MGLLHSNYLIKSFKIKIGVNYGNKKEKKKKKNSKLEVDLCSKIEKNIRGISEGSIKKSGK